MKKLFQFILLLLFLSQIQVLFLAPVLAQKNSYGFEFVYSNINPEDIYNTEVAFSISNTLYVDTDRVYAIIGTEKYEDNVGYLSCAYLSIHDQIGNQIALKLLKLKEGLSFNYDPKFCNNIEKLDNGNFIISGTLPLRPDTEDYYYVPFSYVFDRNGDSVLYQEYPKITPMYFLQGIDVVKSPTGELMSLQEEIDIYKDSFFWDYFSESDSFLVNYFEHNPVLVKHYPDGRIMWRKIIPDIFKPISNVENLYGIDVSPNGRYYIISAANLWLQPDSSRFLDPAIFVIDSSGNWLRTLTIPRIPATDSFKEIVRGNSDLELEYFLSDYPVIRASIGQDGYIYYLAVERASKYDLTGLKPYYVNHFIHYGKMDMEGNIIWSRLFDSGLPMYCPLTWSNIDIAPNGDIVIGAYVAFASDRYKYIYKGLLITADSKDGTVKWWKDLRTFDIHEEHSVKGMMVNPINGKIGIVGSVNSIYDLTPEEWEKADTQRRQIQGLINVGWLVVMDSLGRRCEADSLYGFITPPNCPRPRLLVDPQLEIEADIVLYPNPTKAWLTVAINNLQEVFPGQVTCEVYDMLGRKLQSVPLIFDRTNLDFTPYAPAIYMVAIFHNGELVFSGKVRKE